MLIELDRAIEQADKIWFTADQHFGHANIIEFCDRPFASVEEMDTQLVERWNQVVDPSDTVFHLGDFTLGDVEIANSYFSQLNGEIRVLSNPWHHDRRWLINARGSPYIRCDILPPMVVLEMAWGNEHPLAITLCHYPLAEWDRKHYGAWCLHGHSHGKHRGEGFIYDVGVDNNNFYPISLGGIFDVMYGMGWG